MVPGTAAAPSATTTIDAKLLPSWRAASRAHTSPGSNGNSGMSVMVAPPAMPARTAMWPTSRPITSTTMMRSWDSAVVCSRSMASVATCTAVSNPNVISVAPMSLSMVLGIPMQFTPSRPRSRAHERDPLPPTTRNPSSWCRSTATFTRSTPSSYW